MNISQMLVHVANCNAKAVRVDLSTRKPSSPLKDKILNFFDLNPYATADDLIQTGISASESSSRAWVSQLYYDGELDRKVVGKNKRNAKPVYGYIPK